MKRLLRHVKKHSGVQASTVSALTTSAALPSSGFTFVDNSQGASAAVAELSRSLDTALEQIELEGDLNGQLRLQLQRLDNEASKYRNSQLGDEATTEWSCSLSEAQVVSIAWECAASAYDPTRTLTFKSYTFTQDHVVAPSMGGSIKAATFTSVMERDSAQLGNPLLPLLVVAVRGSARKVDHMVYANSWPKNTDSFINISELDLERSSDASTTPLQAHSGFLSSAEALEPVISKRLKKALSHQDAGPSHVLFTGHSAGGAVASLLYLSYLSRRTKHYPSTRFSCITFGSPPVLRPPISLSCQPPQLPDGVTLNLNIINEFDLVTRADAPYILSLVNLYRSIYSDKAPLVQPQEEANPPVQEQSTSAAPARDVGVGQGGDGGKGGSWALPSPYYHHVGERIMLRLRIREEGGGGGVQGGVGEEALEMRAVKVGGEDFGKLLFCRIAVHRRLCYAERVELIIGGKFNGRDGWES